MSTQLALRLPADLLADLDWLVGRCSYSNRTEAMRSTLEAAIKFERSRMIDEQYVTAYNDTPQTDEELEDLPKQSFANLDDEDEDWSWL